jgi:hypothetical protein
MRSWAILPGVILATASLHAACGVPAVTVRDRALRREWVMQRDCRYPARPARLVEIPWSDPIARPADAPSATSAPEAPLIRPGMRLIVVLQSTSAQIYLTGVALEAGRVGQKVLVKAGLGGAPLHAVVRGPGLVELDPEKGGH